MFPIELGQNKRIRQCMAATYIDNVTKHPRHQNTRGGYDSQKSHYCFYIGNGKSYAKSLSHSTIQWISSFCPDNNKSGFEKCVKIYINEPRINLLAFVLYNTKKKKNRRHGFIMPTSSWANIHFRSSFNEINRDKNPFQVDLFDLLNRPMN